VSSCKISKIKIIFSIIPSVLTLSVIRLHRIPSQGHYRINKVEKKVKKGNKE